MVEPTGTTLVNAETDEEKVALDAESQDKTTLKPKEHLVKENVNTASRGVSVVIALELVSTAEPIVFDDEDVTMTMAQTLIKLKAEKARILDEKIAQKLHDEEVQKVAARDEKRAESPRTSKTVKYHIIDWEIHTEGPRKIWKMIRVEEPIEDKKRALWVELKMIFEQDANDVPWMLQRYIHAPLTWRLYSDYGVHHVSSTRVEENNEMARDLVIKIFMEANKSKNKDA
nr:hypothetical protein [Tanacetum cinerariifolium]